MEVIDQTQTQSEVPAEQAPAAVETDLVETLQRVLREQPQPVTLSKLRTLLPKSFRGISPEELTEVLSRQTAANVLWQYPKYRSQQDRFWDRPMPEHIKALLIAALEEGPLAWTELRRKLPMYAQAQAEAVLHEHVSRGLLHRHPRLGRGGERFGRRPADPKDYLHDELVSVFARLEQLGFTPSQLRAGALELLHEEEWAAKPALIAAEPVPTSEPSGT